VADHVTGVDAVREAVAPFSPDGVAARCGIGRHDPQLARDLAAAPRAAVYARIGTCTQEYGTLSQLAGRRAQHADRPPGPRRRDVPKAAAFASNTAGNPASAAASRTGPHTSRVSGAPEVYGELPVTCLAEEIETPGGPDPGADHRGHQPGAVGAERPAPGGARWSSWTSWSAWTST
jgi:hypothetical protein